MAVVSRFLIDKLVGTSLVMHEPVKNTRVMCNACRPGSLLCKGARVAADAIAFTAMRQNMRYQ